MMKKKVAFETLGCKVNFAETEKLKELFANEDYHIVHTDEDPEILIINSCTVTSKAERDARRIINRTRRENEHIFVALVGCSPEFNNQNTELFNQVDAVFGQAEKYKAHLLIPEIIDNQAKKIYIDTDDMVFEAAASIDPENRSRAFIKIQDGCDYYCTYCAVAYARGRRRSMTFDDILPAMQDIYDKGFRETVISGINLGTYDYLGKNFFDVIQLLEDANINMRYRISSIEPNLLTPDIIALVAHSKKICPHFHIPLQAGSDQVLEQMKRRYTTRDFQKLIENIKREMPHAAIGIDVITGFPTETNELFEQGYQFLEQLPFSYLHVFSYSKREGTKAASMKNLVPPGEQKKRTHRLRELSDRKQIEFYQTQLGSEHQVIAEHKPGQDYALGWTENYVRVKFPASEATNELISVKTIRLENNVVLGEKR